MTAVSLIFSQVKHFGVVISNGFVFHVCIFSLHPLFPGSNEVDQIAKIHDIMGTPEPNVLNKFKKYVNSTCTLLLLLSSSNFI